MTQALEAVPITSAADIVAVRQKVRELSIQLKFSLVDQTKMVTAASELARNALEHGKGGSCQMEIIKNGVRQGLRLVFQDQGPGIADVELAMKDGYTTGSGLGLGLSGSKRLVNDFAIHSAPGQGTSVTITRWK
ncbi:MAG: anti-sigma regulatory factor [Candidatus Korobacteraceae bacterium]